MAVSRLRFGDDERMRYFIGDVRDRWRLTRACEGVDVVFHAAALKRVEVGYNDPDEMKQTNIDGTQNVISAAQTAGVKKIIYLSTDKACEPLENNPYGLSKAYAENLFRPVTGIICVRTRYGNVFGSRGSVGPKWSQMLEDGHTHVPVTDPTCTRFFMTMDQAVDLVWDASVTGIHGELMVPTLPALMLGDLAEAWGAKMIVSGLPEYEKRHESMLPGVSSDKARRMTQDELRDLRAAL